VTFTGHLLAFERVGDSNEVGDLDEGYFLELRHYTTVVIEVDIISLYRYDGRL